MTSLIVSGSNPKDQCVNSAGTANSKPMVRCFFSVATRYSEAASISTKRIEIKPPEYPLNNPGRANSNNRQVSRLKKPKGGFAVDTVFSLTVIGEMAIAVILLR